MKKLGNKRIKTKTGKRMQISAPAAAGELFDQILELSKERRRVIMFCACPQPMYLGRAACHRTVVADLLLKEAKKRGFALELSEWPGEKPVSIAVRANKSQEIAMNKDVCNIPLGSPSKRIPSLAVLGWGSRIRFESSDAYTTIITGPADVQRGQWTLGIYARATLLGKAKASALSRKFVKKAGYGHHSLR
jgi:hypothetical protein